LRTRSTWTMVASPVGSAWRVATKKWVRNKKVGEKQPIEAESGEGGEGEGKGNGAWPKWMRDGAKILEGCPDRGSEWKAAVATWARLEETYGFKSWVSAPSEA
jgi:hypothetical protein